ncbi:MAG: ATP-binding protein [Candidatus Binatia bacterium]
MKLGTKLIFALVVTVILTMIIHGHLSIQQDQENAMREIRVGMRGFTRAIQNSLRHFYADRQDLNSAQNFLDAIAPRGNIHGVIVYDLNGKLVARSASLTYPDDFPALDPTPIFKLDPAPTLRYGEGTEGYIRDDKTLIYYRIEPIFDSQGKNVGAFVLARHGAGLRLSMEERRDRILATASALMALLSFLIFITVRRNITRPIKQLIERIREIGKGRWDQRIETNGRDEIASLAGEFNLMCEKLQESHVRLMKEQQAKLTLEQDLRHSERLASVGRLAAGIAHEIGTPLNIIGGRAEYLLRRPRSPEEFKDNLGVIRSQSDRITAIVRQLLEFSRRRQPVYRAVDLSALIMNVKRLLAPQIEEKSIRVEMDSPDSLPRLQADPDLLQQVFFNLFSNAFHALTPGGSIKIHLEPIRDRRRGARENVEPRWLRICFEDNGAGIAADHLGRIFDPFFTTKDVGEGSGLGLSVAYGIIEDHGGEIRVESEPAKFTRFIIELPTTHLQVNSDEEKVA